MSIIDQAKQQAIIVLKHCAKPVGFFASGLPGGYEALWARDSMVTSLGACLSSNEFKKTFAKSLELLSENQSEHGQIPNAVGTYNTDRRSDVTFNSIDSSLWYLIGEQAYAKSYKDKSLLRKHKKNIESALTWVQYQDPNEDTLPVQQPTMDWEDAFPHKYGRTINTQALYYGALIMMGENKLANHVRRVVDGEIEKYLSLYDQKLGYYLPWVWKNHDGDREQEEWFDTAGNLLAIITGLATGPISDSILSHIEKEKIDRPYPCKVIYPAIKPGDKEWHSYFSKCDAREPYAYLNGGVWPFIGGFYVAALVKTGKFVKAAQALEDLALANKQGKRMEWEFNEWLHGETGTPGPNSTPYQAWSAGSYLFAYECVRQKRVLFFD